MRRVFLALLHSILNQYTLERRYARRFRLLVVSEVTINLAIDCGGSDWLGLRKVILHHCESFRLLGFV